MAFVYYIIDSKYLERSETLLKLSPTNVGCSTLKPKTAGFKFKIIKTNTRKCWINMIETKILSNSWIKTLNTYFEQYVRCTDSLTPVYIPAGKVSRWYRIWN